MKDLCTAIEPAGLLPSSKKPAAATQIDDGNLDENWLLITEDGRAGEGCAFALTEQATSVVCWYKDEEA